ncbi:MAG: hypothetical protein FJ297_12660 [Planctomycetes bacterium]|nr:hypothetical protein [Planctomycetota bacterium]
MSDDAFDPYRQWLGIDSGERPIDCYRLLGLDRFESDGDRIAEAAEERMRHVRTFQTGPRGVHTQRILNELARAKLRLLDPKSKAAYDERLHESARAAADFLQDDDIGLPEPVGVAVGSHAGFDVDLPQPTIPMTYSVLAAPVLPAPTPHPTGPALGTPRMIGGPFPQQPETGPHIHTARRGARRRSPVIAYVGLVIGAALTIGVGLFVLPYVRDRLRSARDGRPEFETGQSGERAPAPGGHGSLVTYQDAAGKLTLTPGRAKLDGPTAERIDRPGGGTTVELRTREDTVAWRVHFRKRGPFQVKVQYRAPASPAGVRFRVELAGRTAERDLQRGEDDGPFVEDTLVLDVSRPGECDLTLRLSGNSPETDIIVRSVVVVPYRGPSRPGP